jgi:putative NADH-flavin reductase
LKILVLGASGRTGRLVVSRARRDDSMTAMLREPTSLDGECNVVIGDPLAPADVARAIEGQDAVLCAIGPRPTSPHDLCRRATEILLDAMRHAGVRRVVAITGAMVGHPHEHAGLVYRYAERLMRASARELLEDHREQERLLLQSELDFTIVRPPRLTEEPARGDYRVGEDIDIGSMARLGRADLADFLVACVHDLALVRRAVTVAY